MSAMEYFDSLEVRDPAQRERELFAALPEHIALAKALAGVEPRDVTNRRALAALPVTRKSDLHALQQAAPPFGGVNAVVPGALAKIFVSPGPIYDAEGRQADYWRTARALFAAGFRAGDIVQNCFSYHLTPAGSMMEGGLVALGCGVIPGGVGQTELQVSTMADLRAVGYAGTPSFLKLILDKAED